ncbi:MAG: DNA-directed RNA polymerase subunit alpha [Mycoplasmataceae bacterium]|nr:DNA-directed RNA polymerase subunit alpha [Mycoplasmataceae bacterium]
MSKITKINYNEIKSKKISENNTTFVIQPLERGMANTLGTSIRRVLLSSIFGISSFAAKINGITHEYAPIPGVSVDVITLLSNLSLIKFNYNKELFQNEEIIKIYFKNEKEGPVKVSDLNIPSELKLASNDDVVIADAAKKGALEFELFLRADRGYYDSDFNKLIIKKNSANMDSKIKSGSFIAMDSNFSPIVRVSTNVEELNTSSYAVQEKLEFTIETNGTIDAKEALSQAGEIMIAHMQVIGNVENLDLNNIFEDEAPKKENSKFETMTIDDLDLTVRSTNGLRRAKISKVSELISLSESELKNINSIGEKSVNEIVAKLEELKIFLNKGDE